MAIKARNILLITLTALLANGHIALGSTTQARVDNDIDAGVPIVIQVSVALADNKHQWIVPVPPSIGNGQKARTNLYWGARYGVKTYMLKDGGWDKVISLNPRDPRILERLVLKKYFSRNGRRVAVYLVADAWDGRFIRDTIVQFLSFNAGKDVMDVPLQGGKIQAGGKAHLIVYIGHNALMDYVGGKNMTISNPNRIPNKQSNDAIVLACKSRQFFSSRLKRSGAFPLLLTTGLMAPEAYSLQGAIEKWIAGGDVTAVRKAAATNYHKYQKTGQGAAERLFDAK